MMGTQPLHHDTVAGPRRGVVAVAVAVAGVVFGVVVLDVRSQKCLATTGRSGHATKFYWWPDTWESNSRRQRHLPARV